jgi:hypothetical protein
MGDVGGLSLVLCLRLLIGFMLGIKDRLVQVRMS